MLSTTLGKFIMTFLISMIPVVELRGGLPYGILQGLPLPAAACAAILGNMLPVPIIYLFARRFLEWGQDKKYIDKICQFFLVKGSEAGKKMQAKAGRTLFVALFLFVGIPLPGTGAWTGTLAASLLDMNFKETVIAVTLGVLFAGVIMMAISFGVAGAAGAVAG